MENEDFEEPIACSDCRGLFGDTDPSFRFGRSVALCLDCAIRRGGAYDPARDRWERWPDVEELRHADRLDT